MGRNAAPLLEPMGWALARAPLLPVEAYLDERLRRLGADALPRMDPRVGAALPVGSDDLAAALKRTHGSGPNEDMLRGKLLRYLIRMSTRPTPYGLFGGVAMIEWGETTDVAISAEPPRTRARPDMGWLLSLVSDLERDPDIRRELRLFANPLALSRSGWVFLSEPGDHAGRGAEAARKVRVRATPAIRHVLAAARTLIPYAEIASILRDESGATQAEVDRRIAELCRLSFLLTELRPPLTGQDPARHVYEHLPRSVGRARHVANELASFLSELERWDRLRLEERANAWTALAERAGSLHPIPRRHTAARVDTALPLVGAHVQRQVAVEAATAAELLLRLTPHPDGPPGLAAYRARFAQRYGPGREVPLLELLDSDFGIGPPAARDVESAMFQNARDDARRQSLLDLAVDALHDHRPVVELDDDLLSRLESWSPDPETVPLSLELCVSVAAASPAAIDEGNFTVIIGPNHGADSAGRNLGRFGDLLGAGAQAALTAAVADEGDGTRRLRAELVYLPRHTRAANVAVRPAVAGHEIVSGTCPGVPHDRVIPLDELVVGMCGGRFYARWTAEDAEIAASEMHMLNPAQAPAAIRFLREVERDGRPVFSAFDWGPATGFPFLPRLQRGRVVLAPAQWGLEWLAGSLSSTKPFGDVLRQWRERWGVPRYTYLAEADNRLLLDLEDPAHAGVLLHELKRASSGVPRILQEALPGPGDAWLPGPDGRHIVELVVALRAGARMNQPRKTVRPREASTASRSMRLRPPGSDWLFMKLYCPPALEDELIAENVLDLVAFAEASGLAKSWFFVRYADPDAHIRLRFHGDPDQLVVLMQNACGWAEALVTDGLCSRFSFDTYEREIERYGGEAGMELAESIFIADSRAVAELLGGEVGVVQLQGRQAFSQEDRGLASVCGVCHDHDAGHLTLLPWVQFAVPRRSAQVADVAAVTCP